MRNKKGNEGFTLIELLAVIIILAVIALILVPVISGVIENSKKGALQSSTYGLISAANNYYGTHVDNFGDSIEFEINDGVQVDSKPVLDYNGKINMAYILLFKDNKIAICADDGTYVATKGINDNSVTVTEGICTGEYDASTESYLISKISSSLVNISVRSYENVNKLPSSGNSNDIAVITDTKISGFYISSTVPDSLQEGLIWIVQDNNSSTYLKADNVKINVSYVMQYINGSWVMKDSYVYNNSWTRLLYVELDNSVYYKGQDYVYDFAYKEEVQKFVAPFNGTYILEVWGAQGGNTSSYKGGLGGYSKGVYYMNAGDEIYIVTGGAGGTYTCDGVGHAGGYNGGGIGACTSGYYTATGGGATHIALTSGLLKDFNNFRENLLIVAGGGGGSQYYTSAGYGNGGTGGGLTGGDCACSGSSADIAWRGYGATQFNYGRGINVSYAGSFGVGGGGTSNASGGGGGYYGGGGGWGCPAGGGSGYVGGVFSYDDDIRISSPGLNTGNGHARISLQTIQLLSNDEVSALKNSTTTSYVYDYTGVIEKFTAPTTGYYLLEAWGAQGGNAASTKGENLYVVVGGAGRTSITNAGITEAGYNGGGSASSIDASYPTASGGGATHIAKASGLLSSLSSNKNSVLLVAGGGGGSQFYRSDLGYGNGGAGGGTTGQAGVCNGSYQSVWVGYGGTQTSGGNGTNVSGGMGSFGQGGGYNCTGLYYCGGGGGYYGGGAGWGCPAGGGTGSLSSELESTYSSYSKATYAGNTSYVDANGITSQGKTGNGYAKITFISE